jgi:5-methylcytosine-specific restriction endonuclease McrA
MPIKAENRARYPANWKEIRASILERAGNCCEQCRVANGDMIVRGIDSCAGTFQRYEGDGEVYDAETGRLLGRRKASEYLGNRWTRIVLTIAHLDHVPENCDPSNLKALCQRCHLAYDAEHHAETARETRRARKAIADLFA